MIRCLYAINYYISRANTGMVIALLCMRLLASFIVDCLRFITLLGVCAPSRLQTVLATSPPPGIKGLRHLSFYLSWGVFMAPIYVELSSVVWPKHSPTFVFSLPQCMEGFLFY